MMEIHFFTNMGTSLCSALARSCSVDPKTGSFFMIPLFMSSLRFGLLMKNLFNLFLIRSSSFSTFQSWTHWQPRSWLRARVRFYWSPNRFDFGIIWLEAGKYILVGGIWLLELKLMAFILCWFIVRNWQVIITYPICICNSFSSTLLVWWKQIQQILVHDSVV